MTARELIEEGVDVERGAANVAKILGNRVDDLMMQAMRNAPYPTSQEEPAKPARKRRSDAGKPKAKKQETAILSEDDQKCLMMLINNLVVSERELSEAIIARDNTQLELNAFLRDKGLVL